MIQHLITGSLSQWTITDPKTKEEKWRGYIIAKLLYGDEEREKFPFLVHHSYKNVDERWIRSIYLNAEGVWQGLFTLLVDEDRAKELMANLRKPEFKDFVELLSPLVPADFKMPKIKKKALTTAQGELF